MTPIRTGVALAITVGLFYALWVLLAGMFFAWLHNRLAS
jgi:hypothetical protein